MGWTFSDKFDHEGFVCGFVAVKPSPRPEVVREVGFHPDDQKCKLDQISSGCSCGWRSPRWQPSGAANWQPCIVTCSERDEERAHQLWLRHVQSDDCKV